MKIYQRVALVGVLVAVSLTQLSSASAAPASDAPIEFGEPDSLTIEYGTSWAFEVYSGGIFLNELYSRNLDVVTSTGVPSGYKPRFYLSFASSGPEAGDPSGYLYPDNEADPLAAGVYTFSISGKTAAGASYGPWDGKTPTPARLTIIAAPLTIDLRALPDPNRPDATIITARLTGAYIERHNQGLDYSSAPEMPVGTWNIVVTDEAGEVAAEYSHDVAADDASGASGFYWTKGEAEMEYTAKATFTPTGTAVGNFDVSPSSEFSFTPSADARPVPTSTAVAGEGASSDAEGGLAVPVGLLVLAGLVFAGLASFGTVLVLKLRALPGAAPEVVK